MLKRGTLLIFTVTALFAATDRQAAEWIIRKHGRVMLDGSRQPIASLSDLPAGAFQVTGIDLTGTVLAPAELSSIAGLEHVRELFLPGSAFTPGAGNRMEGNAELKVIAGFKELERLQFSLHFLPYFNVTDAGFSTFNGITNLKELRCAQCRISKRGLDPFVNLESLDMSYSQFGNDSMASLAGMKNLRRLLLRDTTVTDEGLKHIAGLTKLEELDLYGAKVTDQGIAHLKDLKEMRKLILLGAPITDESIPVIAGMTKLVELNLYRSRITNAGIARLAALRDLQAIDLRYSRVTSTGIESLRAALPKAEIEFVGGAPASTSAKAVKPGGNLAQWVTALGGKAVVTGGRVREISFATARIGDAHIANLTGPIQKLNLEATEVGDLGVQKLAGLKDLQELNLSYTTVTDAGLAALQSLPNLKVLRLAGAQISGAGLDGLKTVVDLDLSGCPVKAIPILPAVERLNLSGTDVSDAALADLAKLPALRSLNLNSTDVGDSGLKHLAALTNLRELGLNYGRFTDKGLDALKTLTNLRKIEMVRTRAGAVAAGALAAMRNLEDVNLDYTSIDAKSFPLLQGLPQLRRLSLDSLDVGDESVDILASMPSLQWVNLYHTLVTANGADKLKKAMPKTQIVWDRDSARPNRRKT